MASTTAILEDDEPRQKRSDDLTSGLVHKRLFGLWLPMIGGILAVKSIGLSDAYFISQLGEGPLAAVSFTFPIVMILISLAVGLSAGASSILSRRIGADKSDEEKQAIVAGNLSLAVGLAVLLGGLGALLINPVLQLMGASGETLKDASLYMYIWFAGAVFLIIPIVANGILRATGDGVSPAVLMTGVALLNIGLNPLFIFGVGVLPELGMHGAAVATVLARGVATLCACALLFHKNLFNMRLHIVKRGLADWKEIVRIGLPASLSTSVNPMALSIATAAVATLGQSEVAAFGVATKIQSIAIVPLLALSSASSPFAGQNSGAGLTDRSRTMLYWCAGISVCWATLAAGVFWLLGGTLAEVFVSSDRGIEVLTLYLAIVPISYLGYGIVISLSAALNGIGKSLKALIAAAGRALALLAPAAWIGVSVAGFAGLAWGFLTANLLSGALALLGMKYLSLSEAGQSGHSDESEADG